MDVEIGSNVFKNADGTIEVEGVPLIDLALKSPEGPLLVNFVVFDPNCRVIAKVVRSSLAFNESGAYSLDRTPTGLTLTESKTGKVILQVELKEPNRVMIRKGEFITARGRLMEVSPVDWRIGDTRSTSGEQELDGGPVTIG